MFTHAWPGDKVENKLELGHNEGGGGRRRNMKPKQLKTKTYHRSIGKGLASIVGKEGLRVRLEG